MELSSTVLVVVDVQKGFITTESDFVVSRIEKLVDRWLRAGGEVLFTRYLNYSNSPYERLIHWSNLKEAPETDLADELVPFTEQPGTYVVDKTIYSLFSDDGAKLVKSHGWTDLIIAGIATESCVLKTAVDAFELGLVPWVLTDAVASHAGAIPHDAGLLVTERFIGEDQVLSSEHVLDLIRPGVPA